MKLPGWIFLLVGAGVMAYSRFIESRQDANLTFFFWIGAIFTVYGLVKEGSRWLTKRKRKEKVGPPPRKEEQQQHTHPAGHAHGNSPHRTHEHTKQQRHTSHPHQAKYKVCPRCHKHNNTDANFCHNCGYGF